MKAIPRVGRNKEDGNEVVEICDFVADAQWIYYKQISPCIIDMFFECVTLFTYSYTMLTDDNRLATYHVAIVGSSESEVVTRWSHRCWDVKWYQLCWHGVAHNSRTR